MKIPEERKKQIEEWEKDPTWLNSFFKFIIKNLEGQEAETRLKRIQIATFNYDRNIEKYMSYLSNIMFSRDIFENNKESNGKSFFEGVFYDDKPERFGNIVHLYGALPKESEFCSENKDLIKFSGNITTYEEFKKRFVDWSHIGDLPIYRTEVIIFLGFGYDEINMKLLARLMNPNKKKKIYGTFYGIDVELKDSIINRIATIFKTEKNDIHLYNVNCKDFFEKIASIENIMSSYL